MYHLFHTQLEVVCFMLLWSVFVSRQKGIHSLFFFLYKKSNEQNISSYLTLLRSNMLLRSRSKAVEHFLIWVTVEYCSFVRQSSHIRMSSNPITAAIGVLNSWLQMQWTCHLFMIWLLSIEDNTLKKSLMG